MVLREEAPLSREPSDATVDGGAAIARGTQTRETTREKSVARRRRDQVAPRDLRPSTPPSTSSFEYPSLSGAKSISSLKNR